MGDGPPAHDAVDGGGSDDAHALADDEYRRFYHRSGVPTLTLDVEHRRILECNQAMLDLTGLPREEILGRPGADLLAEATPDQALRVRALRGEATRTIRNVITRHGTRIAEISVMPSGRDGIVFVQAHDVTDLLEANTMLERRTRELQDKTASLESLSSQMAHDLRGPLATIGGFVDLLRNQADTFPPEQRDAILERVSANVQSLGSMVADILDASLRSQGDLDEDVSNAVADLFGSLRAIFDVELFASGGRLETTAEVERLPVPVRQIRQIVVNLVGNSIKFRRPDRPLVVRLSVTTDGDATVLTVADNGSGIPGDPEALFVEGARGADTDEIDGSGLGLAHSRSAAEALGGTLRAVPTDEGAVVELRLPDIAPTPVDEPTAYGGNYAGGLTARQLDLILELSPTPTLLIDLAARGIVRVNQAAEEMLGLPVSEILGKRAASFLADPTEGETMRSDLLIGGRSGTDTITMIQTANGLVPAVVELAAVPDTTLSIAQFHRVHFDRRGVDRAAEPPTAPAGSSDPAPRHGDPT